MIQFKVGKAGRPIKAYVKQAYLGVPAHSCLCHERKSVFAWSAPILQKRFMHITYYN